MTLKTDHGNSFQRPTVADANWDIIGVKIAHHQTVVTLPTHSILFLGKDRGPNAHSFVNTY